MPPEPAPDEGAYVAMDQVGQWVRYADAKAGLIAAGFAGVLAIVAGQATEIAEAGQRGGAWLVVIIALGVATAVPTLITLWSLVEALAPRPRNKKPVPNRFAWPALALLDEKGLTEHLHGLTAEADAWSQTRILAKIAEEKYTACKSAIIGFVFMTAFGVALVITAGLSQAFAK